MTSDLNDEIISETLLTRKGELASPQVLEIYSHHSPPSN